MQSAENTETVVEDEEPEDLRPRTGYENLKPWPKGVSGNPGGRPKNSLKLYDRERFQNMSDAEKEAFLSLIEPSIRYRMAEGNPTEDRNIKITVPTPILGGLTQLPVTEHTPSLGEGSTQEGAAGEAMGA